MPEPEKSLQRDFYIFWLGQAVSSFGDSFAELAIPLLVLQATGSIVKLGIVTTCSRGGAIVASISSGLLVDRIDRRKVMLASDIGRFALWATLPFLWTKTQSFAILVGAAIISGFLGQVFQIAFLSAVPNIVDRDQIAAANARLHATTAFMYVAGPGIAGIVCHYLGPLTAVGLDALTFVASALSLMAIRLRANDLGTRVASTSVLFNLTAGFRELFSKPTLRWMALLSGALNFFLAARIDLLIFYLKTTLLRSDTSIGIMFSCVAAGSVAGAISSNPLRRRLGLGGAWILLCGLTGFAIALIGFFFSHESIGIGAFVATAAVSWFGESAWAVLTLTYRQESTPDDMLGRVTAAYWLIFTLPAAAGLAVMTAAARSIGVPATMAIIGCFTVFVSFAAVLTPIRQTERHGSLNRRI